jgi:hypothetical protein
MLAVVADGREGAASRAAWQDQPAYSHQTPPTESHRHATPAMAGIGGGRDRIRALVNRLAALQRLSRAVKRLTGPVAVSERQDYPTRRSSFDRAFTLSLR